MTTEQNHDAPVNLEKEVRMAEANANASTNGICKTNESTTCTGGDSHGGHDYFSRATTKNSIRRETEMKANEQYEKLLVRSVNTLWTIVILVGLMLFAAAAASAKTITVTGNGDSIDANDNQVTLREAICAANLNGSCGDAPGGSPGLDIIAFNISSAVGVVTILPTTPLPTITDLLIIDGYTQRPCASNSAPCSKQNTLAAGDNAVLLIEINGSSSDFSILTIAAPNCVIRGLVLNRSPENAIFVANAGSAVITGNFIGTDATGTFAQPNGERGIFIESSGSVVGGNSPAVRNVISGNTYPINGGSAITLYGSNASLNKIMGNFIGTNKNGTGTIGNSQTGVFIWNGAHDNTVGGTTPGERNIISGNDGPGVVINDSSFNTIQGNFIGTDVTGTSAVPNSSGIALAGESHFNKIGNNVAGSGNVISGNETAGVYLSAFSVGPGPTGNKIFGNFIGTQANGTSPLGNGTNGVELDHSAKSNVIGDDLAGAGNVIAFNGTDPVYGPNAGGVYLWSETGAGNIIRGNSIHSNHALGIDLRSKPTTGSEVTPNDLNDSDTGPNKLQNFPVLNSAVISNGNMNMAGTLNSENNKSYIISFYGNPECDASGNGEGRTYIGKTQVSTIANNASFSAALPITIIHSFVTATATDQDGNTSEFSQCRKVTAPVTPGTIAFNGAGYSHAESGGAAAITVTRTGGSDGAVSVQYATTGGGTATANTDYTPVSGTLSWADGDSANKTFMIPITDDTTYETNETVNLSLSNPGGGATLGNQSNVPLTITNDDQQPVLSINDVSLMEGNSGTTPATFSVTLSNASYQQVVVTFATNGSGTAIFGADYQSATNSLVFAPGETSKPVTIMVNGDSQDEPNETFVVQLGPQTNATLAKNLGTGSILNDDTPVFRFSAANYNVAEGAGFKAITVERSGDTAPAVTVNYASNDHSNPADFIPCTSPGAGFASSRCDFTTAVGTLRFAPGETSKSFNVLISQDNYVEGPETLELTLSNPTGGSVVGVPSTAILSITDDPVEPATNTTDNAADFVRSQYHDFLNREPDAPGLAFWTDNIEKCVDPARRPAGLTVEQCVDKQRESTAIAFFSSPEFQMTGGFVYRLYKGSLTGFPNYDNGSPGRFPTFLEFMTDVSQVSEGIVVNNQISGAVVETNRNRLAAEFVQRPEFVAKYGGLNHTFYVEELFNNTGVVATAGEKQALVNGLTNATETRASVLRKVVDGTVVISEGNIQFTTTYGQAFYNQEYRRVFVYMEYVGYLRRNPDAAGFIFWLGKLNQFNGDPFQAEMVRSFILSPEYRSRFGQP